jgi:AraC-like DNA-binding protein
MSQIRRTPADEPFLVVRSSLANAPSGAVIDAHVHGWHQLIYVSAGVITVWTEAGSWVAPPSWGVWAPAGLRHGIRFAGPSAFRTLYFRPDHWAGVPAACSAVTVSPLLRELILRTAAQGMLDRRSAVDMAMATLMLDEFRLSGAPPFDLPQPRTAVTRRAAALFSEAGAYQTTDCVARQLGLGTRTLERQFVTETGITIGSWRQQRALLTSMEQLAGGTSVKAAAAYAGYASASAFIAAFRGLFGTTPARYFDSGPGVPPAA